MPADSDAAEGLGAGLAGTVAVDGSPAVVDGEGTAVDRLGVANGDGLGDGVGVGVGDGDGAGVGVGEGRGVGRGVGLGVGRGVGVAAALTTIVPAIPLSMWTRQMYRYVPGAVKVTWKRPPGSTSPESKAAPSCGSVGPVPLVTVWGSPENVQTTVSPTAIVSVAGSKT